MLTSLLLLIGWQFGLYTSRDRCLRQLKSFTSSSWCIYSSHYTVLVRPEVPIQCTTTYSLHLQRVVVKVCHHYILPNWLVYLHTSRRSTTQIKPVYRHRQSLVSVTATVLYIDPVLYMSCRCPAWYRDRFVFQVSAIFQICDECHAIISASTKHLRQGIPFDSIKPKYTKTSLPAHISRCSR